MNYDVQSSVDIVGLQNTIHLLLVHKKVQPLTFNF